MHNWTAFVGSIIMYCAIVFIEQLFLNMKFENDFDVNMNIDINIQ